MKITKNNTLREEINISSIDRDRSSIIYKYKEKKIVDYLSDGKKILIIFIHGLGDTIMFLPIFYKLKEIYPYCEFDLFLGNGQEEVFKSVSIDVPTSSYDYMFCINFEMSEGKSDNISKQNLCCIEEVGIPLFESQILAKIPETKNPFVAVHFQGTCLPGYTNCDYETAKQIWQEIKEIGMIPIEVHFMHMFHNPVNTKFDFIDNSIRNYPPSLSTLFGLIKNCGAFIGVASGPLCVAASLMPKKTLFLQNKFNIENYFKDIKKIEIDLYKYGDIKKWLLTL